MYPVKLQTVYTYYIKKYVYLDKIVLKMDNQTAIDYSFSLNFHGEHISIWTSTQEMEDYVCHNKM